MVMLLGFLGLVFGSFSGAQVWRLRASQLAEDKQAGEAYDKQEFKALKALMGRKQRDDRSQCLHCMHRLAWYDLLPLVSWLSTRGRCRYCQTKIGNFEPLIELGLGAVFVLSFLFWPVALVSIAAVSMFVLWLVLCVMMTILFAYDAKWFLLPDKIIYPGIVIAGVYAAIAVSIAPDMLAKLITIVGAVAILSGIYFGLWLVSRGAWIGFGDVKLGIILGLAVGSWDLAFLTLFLANLIGVLIVIPGLATKKIDRKTPIPFGPMLITACVVSVLFGQAIITGYTTVIMNMLMV